ncbi:MAG: hypothetical protein ICV83_11060 [Cytophagales bacterium]|nr:hypothetical protein [Cytophagales bacterium]
MNNEETIAWIDRYLNDELQGESLREIEEKLRKDEDFRQEVELQRRLVLKIKENGLRADLERLESELSLAEDAPWPVVTTQPPSAWPDTGEAPARRLGGEEQTAGGPAPSSSLNRTYYAVAAAVALLMVAGATAYLAFNRGPGVFPDPELTTISYEGDAQPPFPVMGVKGDTPPQYVPVLIYPPTGAYTHHYQFADTLRLYGTFAPGRLTVSYRRESGQYELRSDEARYPLRRTEAIEPLVAAPGRD